MRTLLRKQIARFLNITHLIQKLHLLAFLNQISARAHRICRNVSAQVGAKSTSFQSLIFTNTPQRVEHWRNQFHRSLSLSHSVLHSARAQTQAHKILACIIHVSGLDLITIRDSRMRNNAQSLFSSQANTPGKQRIRSWTNNNNNNNNINIINNNSVR